MKTYRYGKASSGIRGDNYIIQEKKWYGWYTLLETKDAQKMQENVDHIKQLGNVCIKMN